MYRRIMIVVDGRPASRYAVQEGIGLASAHGADIEFFTLMPRLVASVADPPSLAAASSPELEQRMRRVADEWLGQMVAQADREGVMARASQGREEDGAAGVVEAAGRRRCELIVVASEGHNAIMRLFLESLIPTLITASPVPVLICKPPSPQRAGGSRSAGAASARSRDSGPEGHWPMTSAPTRLRRALPARRALT